MANSPPVRRLLEHPRSLHRKLPWIPRRASLIGVAALFSVINLAIIITLAVMGIYHMDFYTYWNFILITLLCIGVAALAPFQGWPFSLFLMIALPLVFGSVILVVILILIVIAIDDTVYITGTTADPNAVNPEWNFREIRTGDWIIHGLPLAELAILLLFDLQLIYRALLFHWERSDHWSRRWWIWVWNYVSPLILLILYSIIFDPREKYTDKLSRAAGLGIAIGLNFIIQTLFAFSVRMAQDDVWILPMFYPDYLIRTTVLLRHNEMITGPISCNEPFILHESVYT